LIGGIELGALLMAGLRPNDTVVDFGCGTGRLARQLIPRLAGGHYIGIDIAPTMLVWAERRVRSTIPQAPCQVTWIRQDTTTFPLRAESVDMICAFSVFTHIEHEDTYRYLKDAARIVRPGGRFVFSCLPMDLVAAQHIFLQSAGNDFRERWRQVRNVTTSVDLMTAIAQLAGWTPTHWYAGDRPTIQLPETGEFHGLGQSICVLAKSLSTP
jgi:ubiquinone/menaquinone biosynthesis C-methylase UbiE